MYETIYLKKEFYSLKKNDNNIKDNSLYHIFI